MPCRSAVTHRNSFSSSPAGAVLDVPGVVITHNFYVFHQRSLEHWIIHFTFTSNHRDFLFQRQHDTTVTSYLIYLSLQTQGKHTIDKPHPSCIQTRIKCNLINNLISFSITTRDHKSILSIIGISHGYLEAFSDKKAAATSALVRFYFNASQQFSRTLLCWATCMAVRAPRNRNSRTKSKKALSGRFLPKCERKSPGWTGVTFKTLLALFHHMYCPK